MSWFKGGDAERSDGDSGKVKDAWVSVKTNDDGKVTDVYVGEKGSGSHDHYYEVDKDTTGVVERIDWNK